VKANTDVLVQEQLRAEKGGELREAAGIEPAPEASRLLTPPRCVTDPPEAKLT
jgi:hypothetical protein